MVGTVMLEVQEGAGVVLAVAFTDANGVAVIPASATYRVDCLTTGTELIADTAVPGLAASVDLEIAEAANAIQSNANAFELRRCTITSTAGDGFVSVGYFDWRLRNTIP